MQLYSACSSSVVPICRHAHSRHYLSATATSVSANRTRSSSPGGFFFFLTLSVVCASLGVWQVKRLGQKREAMASRRASLLSGEVPLESVAAVNQFMRVIVRGRLHYDREVFVGRRATPKSDDGAATGMSAMGYFVYTPMTFAREDGGVDVAVVCRGWTSKSSSAAPREVSGDDATLIGVTRAGESAPLGYGGLRSADATSNVFAYVDLPAMSFAMGLTAPPRALVDVISPAPPPGLRRRNIDSYTNFATTPMIHATYAVTWFALAAFGVITAIRFRRPVMAATPSAKSASAVTVTATSPAPNATTARRNQI